MAKTPVTFIVYYIGAFTLWAWGGFNGKISKYLPGPYESSMKRVKAGIVGLFMSFLLITIGFRLYDYFGTSQPKSTYGLTPEQTKEVLEKANRKGVITIKPGEIDELKKRLDSLMLE